MAGESFQPLTTTQAKPTQVDSPIPGQQDKLNALEEIGDVGGITAEVPQEPIQAAAEVDSLAGLRTQEVDPLAEFRTDAGTGLAPREDIFAEDALAETEPLSFAQRGKLGFAATSQEEANLLAQKFGSDNVRIELGEVQFRQDKNSKFVNADPAELEIGDIADLSRFAVEMGIEAPIAAGGFLLGGPPGAAAGAGIGSAAATAVGDVIAEQLFDIQRDPERMGKLQEAGIAGAFGTVFGAAGNKITKFLNARKVAKVLKEGGVDSNMAKIVVAEIEEAVQVARKAGLAKNVAGTKIVLTPAQTVPGEIAAGPTIDAVELAGEQGFKNFQTAQGQMIREGFESIQQAVGKEAGKETRGLGSSFIKTVAEIDKAEGALIREARTQAGKVFGNNPAPLGESGQLLSNLGKKLGASVGPTGKIIGAGVEELSDHLVTPKTVQLQKFSKVISELGESATSKGGLSPDRMEVLVGDLDKIAKSTGGFTSAARENTQANLNTEARNLTKALRKDWKTAVGLGLPEEMREQYVKSLSRFGSIRDSMDVLKNVLKTEDISREALVKDIFSKGKQGLPRIRAVKNIIQADDPALWGDLVGENIERLLKENTNAAKVTNFGNVVKQLEGLGDEALGEMLGDSGFSMKQIKSFFKVAQTASHGRIDTVTAKTKAGLAASVGELVGSPFWHSRIRSLGRIMRFATKGDDLDKLLTPEAIQKAVMSVAPSKRGAMRKGFDELLESRPVQAVGQVIEGAKAAAPAVGSGISRQEVRDF